MASTYAHGDAAPSHIWVAMAASTADPPFFNMSVPITAHSSILVATAPC